MTTIQRSCPFCGNEADTNEDGKGCAGKYYLSCMGCGAEGPVCRTLDKSISAWNDRSATTIDNGYEKTRKQIIIELSRLEEVGWGNEKTYPTINPYIIMEAIEFLKANVKLEEDDART